MIFFKNLFIFSLIISSFIACSEDENEVLLDDGLNSSETFFKVRFNNSEFNSEENLATIINGKLTLIASKGGQSFKIEINNVAERIYNPNSSGVNIEFRPANSAFAYVGKNPDVPATGLINIRKIDLVNKKISATFNFTGYWNNENEMRVPMNFSNGVVNNITFVTDVLPPPPPPPTVQVFTCNFDGQTFTGNDIQAYYFQNNLYISAKRTPQNDEFLVIIYGAEQGGSYNPNNSDQVYLFYQPTGAEFVYWPYDFDNPSAVNGNITVTELDLTNLKVKGTFNYTGYWSDMDNPSTKIFSNGIFDNISIVLGPPPSNDSFFCKVNNVDFNPSDIQVAEVTIASETFIAIGGIKTTERVNVNIHEDLGVGTHPITLTGDAQAAFISTSPEFSLKATTGILTIQEKTFTKIKGTFSYVTETQNGNGPFAITEGTFDVELP